MTAAKTALKCLRVFIVIIACIVLCKISFLLVSTWLDLKVAMQMGMQKYTHKPWNVYHLKTKSDMKRIQRRNATDQLCILCIFDVLKLMKHYLVFIT